MKLKLLILGSFEMTRDPVLCPQRQPKKSENSVAHESVMTHLGSDYDNDCSIPSQHD